MPLLRRALRLVLILCLMGLVAGGTTLGVLYWLIAPTLPSVESLRDVRLQVPLGVFSSEGKLIAEFGETRRRPVTIDQVPDRVKNAFIAIEDARFYEHPGVDWRGVTRAIWLLATSSNQRVAGGSTITQQVAKMFFLSSEYSYTRKLTEMFLALKMERELSKDEIFELYLNKSFFGHRSYGIAAAAEFYYGKSLAELALEEAAMLASIPKFPSSGNPIVNPARAMVRRNYVLQRMQEEGLAEAAEVARARAEPDRAKAHEMPTELDAPWIAEMVRADAVERFGDQAMVDGYRVFATIDARAQEAANRATFRAALDYDRRHGWRGVEAKVELAVDASPEEWQQVLRLRPSYSGLLPAVVLESNAEFAQLGLQDGQTAELDLAALSWAREYLSENRRGDTPRRVDQRLQRGDIVRLMRDEEGAWTLAQLPKVQATLTALSWETGAIKALTGGFNFSLSKFNRATQAQRQPGSSFKPFIYSAAFERGFTPASIVLDAPVVFNDRGTGKTWQPQNDNEEFAGPMRLREAMVSSRNLVSVRVLDAVGVSYARRYVQRFGFPPESLPENLSLSLGTNAAPPLMMARGFAAFTNGGYLIEPYLIERIEDRDGQLIYAAQPRRACAACSQRLDSRSNEGGPDGFDLGPASPAPAPTHDPLVLAEIDPAQDPAVSSELAERAVDARTAYLVHSLLRDVVRRGTGRRAMELGRADVGGKTGTTNEHRDGWFSGFGGPYVVTAWMGMDDFSSLGNGEFASRTALPMWVEFMQAALEGEPEFVLPMPEGIATALIDPGSGKLAGPQQPGALSEIFRIEDLARLQQASDEADAEPVQESFDIF